TKMAGSRSCTRLMAFSKNVSMQLNHLISQFIFIFFSVFSLPPLASPTAGHIASYEQLSAYLTSAFSSGSHTVLLFLQDKLSKDDFTVFGGVFGNKEDSAFKNIEDAMQSSASKVTLPALEWSGSFNMAALLQEKLGVSPVLVDADTLSHLTIKTSVSNLLLINLPYYEIIGKVLSSMKAKNIPYTAIYTGFQPSRVISETQISDQSVGRSLLQAVEPQVKPPIMFNVSGGPCIMLWAQNLTVRLGPSSPWIDLAQGEPSFVGSLCNVIVLFTLMRFLTILLLLISSFSMSKRFYPVSAREWFSLDAVELQFANLSASYIASRDIYAPAEYSFHCQSVANFGDALLHPNTTDRNSSEWRLNFIDFQIQGFGLANSTNFSYASDCASFFTPAIWMGLVTVLLTLLILVYGLHMIMQINTMDRFDDPKGPSISVPQSE
uniref:ATPase H+ transporting accessory protein 1b n=1 Tax=Neolamprologus brichardi TaxID=32507 RepID=A0A3Q4M3X2_NEOBR